jgi:hypothetical protein
MACSPGFAAMPRCARLFAVLIRRAQAGRSGYNGWVDPKTCQRPASCGKVLEQSAAACLHHLATLRAAVVGRILLVGVIVMFGGLIFGGGIGLLRKELSLPMHSTWLGVHD